MEEGKTEIGINAGWGLIIIGILAFVCFFIYLNNTPTEFKMECEFDGIEYVKLENATCWDDDISDNYCPLPSKIRCNVEGKASELALHNLISEVNR